MGNRILIVEDEPDLVELLGYNLRVEGFETRAAGDGVEALKAAKSSTFDLILLDLMLPGMSGIDVCRALKGSPETSSIAIIILTAKTEHTDKIIGLELGADDYITKPFNMRELVARVRAVIRRSGGSTPGEGAIRVEDIYIDPATFMVTKSGKKISLSTTEFKVLYFLVKNKGKIYDRNRILDSVWENGGYVEPRTVDVHIRRLRMLIEDDPANPRYIKTKRGHGYYFDAE